VVDGQKVPIRKTRLRTPDRREQRLAATSCSNVAVHCKLEYGQDDARAFDTQLRRGGEGLPQRLWGREVGGE